MGTYYRRYVTWETLRQTAESELWKEGLIIILLTSVLKWLASLAALTELLGQLKGYRLICRSIPHRP